MFIWLSEMDENPVSIIYNDSLELPIYSHFSTDLLKIDTK